MKVKFSKAIPYTPTFNGNMELPEEDRLVLELTPLPLGDLVDATDALVGSQIDPEKLKEKIAAGELPGAEERKKLHGTLDTLAKYIPAYAKIMRGADGFTLDDVVKYAAFQDLAQEIIGKLVEISSPNKADVKNS